MVEIGSGVKCDLPDFRLSEVGKKFFAGTARSYKI